MSGQMEPGETAAPHVPRWLEYAAAALVLGVIFYFLLRDPSLDAPSETDRAMQLLERGNDAERGSAAWEMQNRPVLDAAPAVPALIRLLRDEALVSPSVARAYAAAQRELAGVPAGRGVPGDVHVGDIAAWSLGKIRSGLVLASVSDGDPGRQLVAVRREIHRALLFHFCSAAEQVKVRMLHIVLGDADPTPIATIDSCGLHDTSPRVRAYAAALFLTYGHTSPSACLAAAPDLIDLISDTDRGVRMTALAALRAISGRDFGGDATRWRAWLLEQQGAGAGAL